MSFTQGLRIHPVHIRPTIALAKNRDGLNLPSRGGHDVEPLTPTLSSFRAAITILLDEIHLFHHADDRISNFLPDLACWPLPSPPPQISILLQTATVRCKRAGPLRSAFLQVAGRARASMRTRPPLRGNYPASMWRVESLVCELAEGCP
jgi:hypothetical protein